MTNPAAFLLQAAGPNGWLTFAVMLLFGLSGLVGGWIATSRKSGRHEGSLETKVSEGFSSVNTSLAQMRSDHKEWRDRQEKIDSEQFTRIRDAESHITELRERTARLEGIPRAQARGASAGGSGAH
ncbi:hypothetical protein Acid345_3154 [Candidatus Koribacter versatilis Ellin345]|uniref:Uncharacterized protein n=1 Tax=Koribacter versatilis (strain Ellin345) TaxID=204669 RepID=Q1ILU5_KORVE|nr:hypothetical protein [Candidatus Koribacter versatilis]ABF42155.1 hypothetical protein Acid345_3154 [Candidatus Koribacter versatilis Ellin345]